MHAACGKPELLPAETDRLCPGSLSCTQRGAMLVLGSCQEEGRAGVLVLGRVCNRSMPSAVMSSRIGVSGHLAQVDEYLLGVILW